jgi:predicted  nucleic acid-binding Zn-ribbon protein
MTMVKCNGCGLRINDILFQGTVHEGCAQHGRFIEHGDREARDKAFEQRVAMSQQAVMQGQNLYTQAGWNQMQANQQQMGQNLYEDDRAGNITKLKKHVSELETVVRARDARIKELEAMMHPETGDYVQNKIDAYVEAATMRITQLQNKIDAYVEAGAELEETRTELHRRANSLSDECGALKNENTQLLAENARLRRAR